MRTLPSHMNGGSHHEINRTHNSCERREVRLYDISGVYNNFQKNLIGHLKSFTTMIVAMLLLYI